MTGVELRLTQGTPLEDSSPSVVHSLAAEHVADFWRGWPAMASPAPTPWQAPRPEIPEVNCKLAPASVQSVPAFEHQELRVEAWAVGRKDWNSINPRPIDRLFVLFSQPMGSLGQADVPADLVQLEPQLKGYWAWNDPYSLVFWLDEGYQTLHLSAAGAQFRFGSDGSCQRL